MGSFAPLKSGESSVALGVAQAPPHGASPPPVFVQKPGGAGAFVVPTPSIAFTDLVAWAF